MPHSFTDPPAGPIHVRPEVLAAAAAEAVLDGCVPSERLTPDEEKRKARYGWVDAPHQPTTDEMLSWEDDERLAAHLAITPQPDTGRCPHCAGTGRVRVSPEAIS